MKIRGIIILSISFVLAFNTFGQLRPFINSLSKYSAAPGEKITINGSNFVASSVVSFGSGIVTPTFISSTQLEVIVPTTATYAPVSVTNTATGLSASSARFFMMSFGGTDLAASAFSTQTTFDEGSSNKLVWDGCLCDLDADGDLDISTTHRGTSTMNVIRNNSTIATIGYLSPGTVGPVNPVNAGFENNIILCEDIDGDGKKDISFTALASRQTRHITIYRNIYSGSNSINITEAYTIDVPQTSGATNRSINRFQIRDMDSDGKKDIIAGSDNDPSIFVYLNTSTVGNISFSTSPLKLSMPDASANASLLDIGEMNGDNLPDIVATSNGTGAIVLFKNQSNNGTLRFTTSQLNLNQDKANIKVADFNNDGLGDLVITSVNNNAASNNVIIYSNNTPDISSDISLSQIQTVSFAQVSGVDAGDLNGDGKVDLAIGSLLNGIILMPNTSANGVVSFGSAIPIPVSKILPANTVQNAVRNIKIADMNGDAKPDLAFTFNSRDGQNGQFSVIPNRTCIAPVFTPEVLTFCYDDQFTLKAPKVFGVTYNWSSPNAPSTTFVDNTLETVQVTVPAGSLTPVQIKLTLTSTDGSCTDEVTQSYSLTGGAPPVAPTININKAGTLCGGDDFILSSPTTGDAYLWVRPDGSEVTTQTLSITDAGTADAGIYELRVQATGACYSEPGLFSVDLDIPPALSIFNQGASDNFCVGSNVTLEVSQYNGFTTEWVKDDVATGNNTKMITATTSGVYKVTVKSNATNCITSTESYEVSAIAEPSAMINASATAICVDVSLDFDANSSTGESGFAMSHSWDFKDGTTATGLTASHTFATAGTYLVELTSSYDDVDACEDVMTVSVTVSDIPTIDITVIGGSTTKCPSDSIRLELPQNYQSYLWSTGDTEYFTYAKTTATESSVDITADVVTDLGCTTTTQITTVSNYANSGILITADAGAVISNDTITLATGVRTVGLTASTTGGSNYLWESDDLTILSQTAGETTVVSPRQGLTTVVATATDVNGCTESKSVVIKKPGLEPAKAFSPNNDGINECWEIINSEDQAGCTIYVFDSRGRTIFEGKSPFADNCVWNGKIGGNGSEAPEGVYYFVLKCSDKFSSQTGSILLAR